MGFLKSFFEVPAEVIKAAINCHLDYGLSYEEVRDFWCEELGVLGENFYKPTLLEGKERTKGQHTRLKYGTCRVVVHDVKLTQRLYGAIQELAHIDKSQWLG